MSKITNDDLIRSGKGCFKVVTTLNSSIVSYCTHRPMSMGVKGLTRSILPRTYYFDNIALLHVRSGNTCDHAYIFNGGWGLRRNVRRGAHWIDFLAHHTSNCFPHTSVLFAAFQSECAQCCRPAGCNDMQILSIRRLAWCNQIGRH